MSKISTVILAAGKSSRFKSSKSKLLHNLSGLPIICHVYNTAKIISGNNIIVVCNKKNIIELKNILPNCKFVIQNNQNGTADAIKVAKPQIKTKNFIILFGDVPLINPNTIKRLVKKNKSIGRMIAFKSKNPFGYGRVFVKSKKVVEVVEEINTNTYQKKNKLCNSGIVLVNTEYFFNKLKFIKKNKKNNEKYLPDIFNIFYNYNNPFEYIVCDEDEMLGVNTLEDLIDVERIYQKNLIKKFIKSGVLIQNANSCYFGYDTKIAKNVVIENNVVLKEKTQIKEGCVIKSNSYIEGATIDKNCTIGPHARIRPKTNIKNNSKIGNYVEIKNSFIGEKTAISHLSYIGDAIIGNRVNIGAGTITCNFDGERKNLTIIKNGVFIGSNSSLIAPIIINKNVKIGAGSVVDQDIPSNYLALERSQLKIIKKK
ncbi:MAG: UDP-N-acetylglucosamine diphosphorylase/glucosamine-1-phosphate N-acetyltransferase [Pelagibacteraceae bacterium]|nr:UDP-N-acetylglucosamine diphosphorylase/glucosamine-1-phosphate N-acetyltransferase [Pelagibacteraceae bacterium]|tara:strand:- start:36883 stop:38163 length:1281 start_codon:yes stop_codon:yes gene_type:complete